MSLDDTFAENAPTVGPQIRTLRLVEHVKPEQEQAYLEWSREFSDAHANFIAARDPESWSSVVMIRDRAFGRNDIRYIKAESGVRALVRSWRWRAGGISTLPARHRRDARAGVSLPGRRNIPGVDGFRRATGDDPQGASFELRGR